jgi:hypothetical protein
MDKHSSATRRKSVIHEDFSRERGKSPTFWSHCWFAGIVFLLGLCAMARAYQYYGHLLSGWDAQFYYAAARSIVFDHDLDITSNLEATPFSAPFDRDKVGDFNSPKLPRDDKHRIINKYPIGMSIIEVPFLTLGYGIRHCLVMGGIRYPEPCGYSPIEIWTVAVSLLAIFAIGMQVLNTLLNPYILSPWKEIAILAAWFGTSLFYYSSIFPFMTHAVAFTLVVWIIYISRNLVDNNTPNNRELILLGIGLACLFLVRPQQILLALILVPFTFRILVKPWRTWLYGALIGLAFLASGLFIQALVNYYSIGRWTLNAYSQVGEGFSWLHPAFYVVLISPTRGLFWMSPITLLAAIGFFLTKPEKIPRIFMVFLFNGILQIYVISCWWSSGQGDAFGARMWSECAGAVACGIALLYNMRSGYTKLYIALCSAILVIWNAGLMYLYISGPLRDSHEQHLNSFTQILSLWWTRILHL